MSIKASIRSAGTKVTANTVGIIPVLNGNTTLNGGLTINGDLATTGNFSMNSSGTSAVSIASTHTGTNVLHVNAQTDTITVPNLTVQNNAVITNDLTLTGAKTKIRLDSNSGSAVVHSDDVTLVIGAGNNVGDGTNDGSAEGANIELMHGAHGGHPGSIFYDARKHTFRTNDASSTYMTIDSPGNIVHNGDLQSNNLTLIDSPSNTGGVLRVRSSGSDPDPSYNNIRVEGTDSILTAGQLKIWKPLTDAGNEEVGQYGLSYVGDASNNKLSVLGTVHGDGSIAGPVIIEASGESARLDLIGTASGNGSNSAIANLTASDGPTQVNLTSSGSLGSRIKIEHSGVGEIFQAFGLDSDTHNTGTIQLGGSSGFKIQRTFDGANYSHSITATNLSIGAFECSGQITASSVAASTGSFGAISGPITTASQPNITTATNLTSVGTLNSPMTTGAITVTRAGATYANAPRLDLIDSDGTNQRCSVINSGGNLQFEARNGSTKGIISFIQNAGGVRTTAMKISSGGKVGIGVPSDNVLEDFHVGGNARIDGDFFGNIGSNTFVVKSSTNNVGIGTSAPPVSFKLAVAGDSRFTGSGIFGTTATGGNKGLQKHYCYGDGGALQLRRGTSSSNIMVMKYLTNSSNEFVFSQRTGSDRIMKFETSTAKFISNLEVGGNGNPKALMIRDGRDSADGIRFTHTGVADEVQMGMYGSYGHVDQGRFKITHKNGTDANTVVLQIEKNGTKVTISKPTTITQQLNLGTSVPVYLTNSAAKAGGLVNGDVYRNTTGQLFVVYT